MSMLETVENYFNDEDGREAERAVFEAAMTKRIETQGYTLRELMFEIYKLQLDVRALKECFFHPKKKPESKKGAQ